MIPALTGILAPHGLATSFESIATVTGTGSSGTVTFSSIPSTYQHLQIRQMMRTDYAATDIGWIFRFNSDTGNNYSWHSLYGNGTSPVTDYSTSVSYVNVGYGNGSSVAANTMGVSVVDILDYASTNKYKTTKALSGNDRNGGGIVTLMSGCWMSTNAITSISIIAGAGNFTTSSTFALYGVKA